MNSTIIEIILIIFGVVWVVLFFLWLALGRKVKSKTETMVIDTILIIFSLITMFLAMLLRQEYIRDRTIPDCSVESSRYTSGVYDMIL